MFNFLDPGIINLKELDSVELYALRILVVKEEIMPDSITNLCIVQCVTDISASLNSLFTDYSSLKQVEIDNCVFKDVKNEESYVLESVESALIKNLSAGRFLYGLRNLLNGFDYLKDLVLHNVNFRNLQELDVIVTVVSRKLIRFAFTGVKQKGLVLKLRGFKSLLELNINNQVFIELIIKRDQEFNIVCNKIFKKRYTKVFILYFF